MKRIISFLLTAVFCVTLISFDATAAGADKKVYDPENLMLDDFEGSYEDTFTSVANEYSVDAIAIVVSSIENQGYTDERDLFNHYIAEYNIGVDGNAILMLVEKDTRKQYYQTMGIANDIFTNEILINMTANVQDALDVGAIESCVLLYSWDVETYIFDYLVAQGIIEDPFQPPEVDVPDIPDDPVFQTKPEIPSYAEGEYNDSLPRVVDEVGLMSEGEISQLEKMMREILEEYEFDCSVVIVDSFFPEANNIMSFADDYYDYGGYGVGPEADGIMFVVAMDSREWWLTTCGYGMTALNDYGLKWIEDEVISMLSDGDYYDCFERYAEIVDIFVKEAKENKPYSVTHKYITVAHVWKASKTPLIVGVIISAIIAFIVASILKRKMKTVKQKPFAREYLRNNSFVVTRSADTFMYTRTSRTARNSGGSGGRRGGHRSSSGRSHGGRGGRF